MNENLGPTSCNAWVAYVISGAVWGGTRNRTTPGGAGARACSVDDGSHEHEKRIKSDERLRSVQMIHGPVASDRRHFAREVAESTAAGSAAPFGAFALDLQWHVEMLTYSTSRSTRRAMLSPKLGDCWRGPENDSRVGRIEGNQDGPALRSFSDQHKSEAVERIAGQIAENSPTVISTAKSQSA